MKSIKWTLGIAVASFIVFFFLSNCGSEKKQQISASENRPGQASMVEKQPIIDVHVHAWKAWRAEDGQMEWPEWLPRDFLPAPKTDEDLLQGTLDMFKRYNIVKAVAFGEALDKWKAEAPDLIIPGFQTGIAGTKPEEISSLRQGFMEGRYAVLGEVLNEYEGLNPNDPQVERFFALVEELDKPTAIHMGLGYPGISSFRMSLGNPLLYEDALVRHPKLRLYVCHAGWPFLDETIALLYYYPQVYVDISVLNWWIPRKEFHAYLRRLVEAGYGKRIMFGSDNMYWPESIPLAVEGIESADFLTPEQKRDIFYNNAARFLRLN